MINLKKHLDHTNTSGLNYFTTIENRYKIYYSSYFYVLDTTENHMSEFTSNETLDKEISERLVKFYKILLSIDID
jgi:hypothetical protein